MKFKINNLGVISQADIELNKLTIICGENSTGKTYVTYAIYGFLKKVKNILNEFLFDNLEVSDEGSFNINLIELYNSIIDEETSKINGKYSDELPNIFASSKVRFANSSFEFLFNDDFDVLGVEHSSSVKLEDSLVFTMNKEKGSGELAVIIMNNDNGDFAPFIKTLVADAIMDIFFENVIPRVFISSAERTGAAIFSKELDFARSKKLNELSLMHKIRMSTVRDWVNVSSRYALPIKDNVDFVRGIESTDFINSNFLEKNTNIEDDFYALVGGKYHIVNNNLVFSPRGDSAKKFSMAESSSSIRAILDIYFYMKKLARVDDFLIIDEPELNLHPKNQRLFARLIAHIVNSGIKVLMTTHSDYIIKEMNSLIMLNALSDDEFSSFNKRYGYDKQHLLNHKDVSLYVTSPVDSGRKMFTLKNVEINEKYGIEVDSFDSNIDEMNDIQESIVNLIASDYISGIED